MSCCLFVLFVCCLFSAVVCVDGFVTFFLVLLHAYLLQVVWLFV